jgi:hypothetical protein
MCHYDGDENNPDLDFSDSDGFGGGPGVGCMGCHGRDYGGDVGVTALGMREHHRIVGVSSCGLSSCHSGDDDLDVLPEDVLPPYYGSFETRAWDVCNRDPFYGENFTIGDVRGLDNDGDNVYDEDDLDCEAVKKLCPEDVDGDGMVSVTDLTAVILDWGVNPNSPADINGDGIVNVEDLTAVILAWGDCP